jgi:hypothetical protein
MQHQNSTFSFVAVWVTRQWQAVRQAWAAAKQRRQDSYYLELAQQDPRLMTELRVARDRAEAQGSFDEALLPLAAQAPVVAPRREVDAQAMAWVRGARGSVYYV